MRVSYGIVFGSEVHVRDCFGAHQCGGVYTCNRCERLCGWCFGMADDMPALCDDCWAALASRAERTGGDDG